MSSAKDFMRNAHQQTQNQANAPIVPTATPNYAAVVHQPGAPAPVPGMTPNVPSQNPFTPPVNDGAFHTPHVPQETWAVKQVPPTEPPVTPPPAQEPVKQPEAKAPVQQQPAKQRKEEEAEPKRKSTKTSVEQIARPDVPMSNYGVRPVATNFNCYNKEVFNWLRTFSSDNQFNGGVAITKSQLIEIVLDVMVYDLNIQAQGYASQQELREAIQVAMMAYNGQNEN